MIMLVLVLALTLQQRQACKRQQACLLPAIAARGHQVHMCGSNTQAAVLQLRCPILAPGLICVAFLNHNRG